MGVLLGNEQWFDCISNDLLKTFRFYLIVLFETIPVNFDGFLTTKLWRMERS